MSAPDKSHPSGGGDLTATERKLLSAAITGTPVNLRTGDAKRDNPAQAGNWGSVRTIRADMLIDLLIGDRTPEDGRLRAVKLCGARITGSLDLEAATLTCPLLLQDCHFDESVNLNEASAPVLRMPGCHLPALTANHLRTAGNLELNHGFTARGEVSLWGAHIGGLLDLSGASLDNPGGRALYAVLLTAEHGMRCQNGFSAHGEVRLRGARIAGLLDLSGASLDNPGGWALYADGLDAKYGMLCQRGFAAHGEVCLSGARIGVQLDFSGAVLDNPGGCALQADGLDARYGVLCRDGFTARGEVRLRGANIGWQLDLREANLTNPGAVALNLEAADVAALYLLPAQRPDGMVILTNAKAGAFADDPASWPAELNLRGFTYDALENDQVDTPERLRWLALHSGSYIPQLYNQLAAVYQRGGQDEAARKVRIAKQWRRRAALNPAGKLLNWLLYVTVGYGYRTWLAGVWLAGLLALGTWVFGNAYPRHMTPATSHPAAFHSIAYTLDVLLPFVNLGQQNSWQPQGSALYWSWALTGAGWVLATAVVAGLTGIFNRD